MPSSSAGHWPAMPRTLIVALCLAMALPLVQAATTEQLLTGELVIDIVDDFAHGASTQQATLQVGGEQLALEGVDPEAFAPGTIVQVRGHRVGNSIQVASGGLSVVGDGAALAATTATATFDKRVAVLLINFVEPTPSPTAPPPPTDTPQPTDSEQPSETPLPTESLSPSATPEPSTTPEPSPTTEPSVTPEPSATPEQSATPDPSATPEPSPTPGPTPPPEPWTKPFVRGVYFDNTRSVASYYSELSDGRMSITGDVFGYFTLTAGTSSCSYNSWGSAARDAASAAGIDLSAYTNIVYVLPRQDRCSWGGIANLPGRHSYINGSHRWSSSTWLYVTSHELGHNFGANHAATASCTRYDTRVAFSSDCSTDDYGDPFDIMGFQGQRHMSTWHRWQLGLLDAADVQTVSATGEYTVATAEIAGGSPRILRIPRGSNYYYLEFRQPFGRYDNFSVGAAAVNGVFIRSGPDVDRLLFSKLIDTTPWTSSYNDAALAVGQGFGDSVNDICVITQSVGAAGATVFVHLGPDDIPPTTVGALTATTDGHGVVSLAWPPTTDDLLLTGYQVARDGTPIGIAYGTSFVDRDASQARSHDWSVSGLDCVGNLGGAASASVFLPDTTTPGVPPALSAIVRDADTVDLSWGAAKDNVGVTGYRVSRNGVVLLTTSQTSLVDEPVPSNVELDYQVVAIDAAGNVGKPARASARDVTPPIWNGALALSIGPGGVVQLTWPEATDNAGVTAYEVRRDGTPFAVVTTTTLDDPTVEQLHDYGYTVVASDAASNRSTGLTGTIHVPDVTPPESVGNLTAQQAGPRLIDLSWTAPTDNVGVDHYLVTMDGEALASTTVATLAGVVAADGLTHEFGVVAVDSAGNVGPEATTQLTLPDVTPPGAPGLLVATATGPTTVQLTWSAAFDNVGVTSYRLTRDGGFVANVGGDATGFTDSGVPSDHTYSYALEALDEAGNAGPVASASVSLVSVDLVAPAAPAGLKASAIGGRRVSLAWFASTDNRPGTIRYKVFRGTRKLATVTSLGYVDRPASVGTYRYRVRAIDAAGNVSVYTAWVTVRAKR